MLIRDGATLVRNAADVIEALNTRAEEPTKTAADPQAPKAPFSRRVADLHRQILDRLGPNPVPEDQLIRDLECDASVVSPEITTLEIEGKVRREPGGMLARTE